jgi:hypothetical protein
MTRLLVTIVVALLVASTSHAQTFDKAGTVIAGVDALQCNELEKFDAVYAPGVSRAVLGSFGMAYIRGFVYGVFWYTNTEPTTQQDRKNGQQMMTAHDKFTLSINIVDANIRTFCIDKANATSSIIDALTALIKQIFQQREN